MTPTTTRWCKDINMWTIDRPINDIKDTDGSVIVYGSCSPRYSSITKR